MSQYLSQVLFDQLALSLTFNTAFDQQEAPASQEIRAFLLEVRDEFPADDFGSDLFAAARWLKQWTAATFGPDGEAEREAIRLLNDRCQHFDPSGCPRSAHACDSQTLPPRSMERVLAFKQHVTAYARQLPV